jgi:hypothetical protein
MRPTRSTKAGNQLLILRGQIDNIDRTMLLQLLKYHLTQITF